jgi:hypothetical protein
VQINIGASTVSQHTIAVNACIGWPKSTLITHVTNMLDRTLIVLLESLALCWTVRDVEGGRHKVDWGWPIMERILTSQQQQCRPSHHAQVRASAPLQGTLSGGSVACIHVQRFNQSMLVDHSHALHHVRKVDWNTTLGSQVSSMLAQTIHCSIRMIIYSTRTTREPLRN